MTTPTDEAVRQQFEAEAKSRFWDIRRSGEQYVNTATQHSWEGYQAALRSPAVAGLVEAANRDAQAHEYFASNADLRMTTGDHHSRANKLRAALAQYATLAGESHE